MFVLSLTLLELTGALPFVTTWRTAAANEAIVLPPIIAQTAVTVNWGDGTPNSTIAAGQRSFSFNHTYFSPGLHNVSMDGEIFWTQADSKTTKAKLVDIVSWGDGFLVQYNTSLFTSYSNLQVSASPDSQPKFLAGADLYYMFLNSAFNSSLNWDLTNVTSLMYMFAGTPLNQPINFRNTQGVQSTASMFRSALYFNQPFHFDASGLLDAKSMFYSASSFNQVVNLTNSSLLKVTSYMFRDAVSFNQLVICDTSSVTDMQWMFCGATNFNQPVNFNTSSVTNMQSMFGETNFNQPVNFNTKSVTNMVAMFAGAKKFNQPVNFNTSQVTTMNYMFDQAESFNQPINFDAPKLTAAFDMFNKASSFNQPVVMNAPNVTTLSSMFENAVNFSSTVTFTSTAKVTDMTDMFSGVNGFTQDLSSWDTQGVIQCTNFCPWCGLPAFPSCQPCPTRYTVGQMSVCSTLAPTPAYQSSAPSRAPATGVPSSLAPSLATGVPSSRAPSPATGVPSSAPSLATGVPSSRAPSLATGVPSSRAPSPATGVPSSLAPSPATGVPSSRAPSGVAPSVDPSSSVSAATPAATASALAVLVSFVVGLKTQRF